MSLLSFYLALTSKAADVLPSTYGTAPQRQTCWAWQDKSRLLSQHVNTKAVRADVRFYRALRRRCLVPSEIGMGWTRCAACKMIGSSATR
jgi:hypothetical protein